MYRNFCCIFANDEREDLGAKNTVDHTMRIGFSRRASFVLNQDQYHRTLGHFTRWVARNFMIPISDYALSIEIVASRKWEIFQLTQYGPHCLDILHSHPHSIELERLEVELMIFLEEEVKDQAELSVYKLMQSGEGSHIPRCNWLECFVGMSAVQPANHASPRTFQCLLRDGVAGNRHQFKQACW